MTGRLDWEEAEEQLARWQRGGEAEQLFIDLDRFLRGVLQRRYAFFRSDVFEDIVSEAWVELVPRLRRYDSTLSRLEKFVVVSIYFATDHALRRMLENSHARLRCIELRYEVEGRQRRDVEIVDDRIDVETLLSRLDDYPLTQECVRRYYLEGVPPAELYKDLNFSRQRLYQHLQQGLERMRHPRKQRDGNARNRTSADRSRAENAQDAELR